MSAQLMVDSHDETLRRQEIIDAMESTFLQELAKAGANVPPRSTVTTAFLRGLLWDKREDELLTKGHTTIETQVVKNSRRSALLQLVSQVWKVPKPEYDKVDSLLSTSSNDSIRLSLGHMTPTAPSPTPDGIEANTTRTRTSIPSSLGSSAEYDAYEALSSLSDAMAVDEPTPSIHQSASWTTDQLGSSRAKDDRHVEALREPIDSVTSVIFRSSPQLTSIKFTRSGGPNQDNVSSPIFGGFLQSQNRFKSHKAPSLGAGGAFGGKSSTSGSLSKGPATGSHQSPRSNASSPSSSSGLGGTPSGPGGFFPPPSHLSSASSPQTDSRSEQRSSSDRNQPSEGQAPRSRFPLPIDLKSLLRDSSSNSPSSTPSEDSPLAESAPYRSSSARSSTSSHRHSPITPTAPFGWGGNAVPHPQFAGAEPPPMISSSPAPPLNGMFPTHPSGAFSMDPRALGLPAAVLGPTPFGSPTDHVPVWVPRSNPLVPLVLCPVRSPQGEWFYTYQPISYSDMSVLLSNAAVIPPQTSHTPPR